MTEAKNQYNKSSDIFNLNSIEAKPAIRIRNNNNRTTYDFKNWGDENNNNLNQSLKPYYSKNFQSSVFSEEPIKIQTSRNRNINRSNLTFGNYDNSEFNVHKNLNNKTFNPNYKEKETTAYERKMKQLYGNNFSLDNKTSNYKLEKKNTAYGTIEKEKKKYDEEKREFKNAKERKYDELFHDRKEVKKENNNKIYTINSSNNKYIEGINSNRQNHINSLKSNIFNDPERDDFNIKQEIKVNKRENNNDNENIYHGKKKTLEQETGILPSKLDWKNEKTNLYNKERPFSTRIKENAFERKINELYGENAPKNKINNDNNEMERKKIEEIIQNKFPNENESQIKKRLENISDLNNYDYNNKKTLNENIINKNYEIQFDKINNVNINEFKKVFIENGIHIYGIKEDESYNNGKDKKGKITFSIRENFNKEEFDDKLNKIRNKIEKEQGIKFTDYYDKDKRKKIGKVLPSNIKWDNNLASHYKTELNEKNIIKGNNYLKKGDKITEINIDHNYKRSSKKK